VFSLAWNCSFEKHYTVARSDLQFFSVYLSVFANKFKKPVAQLVVIQNIEIRRQRRGIRRLPNSSAK
jgi:hypothetical protein